LTTGGLEIEERRRRKAEEIIQQVKEGALESLRGDYLTIQANVQETMRQLKAKGLLDKKRDVDQALAAVQNDKAQLTSQITELHRSIETATKTMAKERASIEEQITQLTGQPLQIRTE
jgi:phenylalanyl-tRNA synthetase alpha subunit